MTSGEVTQSLQSNERATLTSHVAAPDYAAQVNAIVVRVANTSEQSAVLALLREGANALGAENAMFLSFVRDDAVMSSCRFLLACDPQWCRLYLQRGCATNDPWLAYAANHSEVIVASTLNAPAPEQQRTVGLAAEHGFRSAVLVPAHSGAGHSRISLLCLGSSVPGFFEDPGFGHLRIGARSLALELHEWWLARIRRELVVKAHVTPNDLVLLRYEHEGQSSKRIAAALQVSKSSINSRFQRMNSKLGVANRKMAARLAAECGLIG